MANDPLVISRAAWTAVERLAGAGANAGSSTGTHGRGADTFGMILIRNATGETLQPDYIVGLDGLVNTPDSHPNEWHVCRFHKAVKPDPDQYAFAVVIEEIAAGKAGLALIDGIHRVMVEVKDAAHQFAVPVKDVVARMESAESGSARLLYRKHASGIVPGLVHFTVGGGGGTAEPDRLVWAQSGSGGITTAQYIEWLADPAANPNWTVAEETLEGRYMIGTSPGARP